MSKLTNFARNSETLAVSFTETMQVKEGVSCDVYAL
jgi:hypothetical protein